MDGPQCKSPVPESFGPDPAAATCAPHDGKQYFYVDKDHLSVHGSERVLAGLFGQFPLN